MWVRTPPSPPFDSYLNKRLCWFTLSRAVSGKQARIPWRGVRVVEGARLESVYTETYRGFESLSLRQVNKEAPPGAFLFAG